MDINGWDKNWNGPRDYRCEFCHCGFMPDEVVYVVKGGLPFHEYCVERTEFNNRIRRGVTVIHPYQRTKQEVE